MGEKGLSPEQNNSHCGSTTGVYRANIVNIAKLIYI